MSTESFDQKGILSQSLPSEGEICQGEECLSFGDRAADKVADFVGSWTYVIGQSVALALWIVLNVMVFIKHWDPYPFILLNLVLSFLAAYTAPIIMMSQNRQAIKDRQVLDKTYANVKREFEVLRGEGVTLQDINAKLEKFLETKCGPPEQS